MSAVSPEALESANSQVMGLMLQQLKTVARHNGLPVSGPKATLQDRIKERLSTCARKSDLRGFLTLQGLIANPNAPSSTASPSRGMGIGVSVPKAKGTPAQQVSLNFRPSPFFEIRQAITPVIEIAPRETARDSVETNIRLTPDVVDQLIRPRPGEHPRLMVYSAAEPIMDQTIVDVAFPNQVEIKINSDDVKANLKGIKNKPGSTRPADITDMVHKKTNYNNIWAIHYALTTKRFFLIVNLVNKIEPVQLAEEIKRRPPLSKDQVIRDMTNRNEDSDIQATSSVMSLKCPLSYVRLETPCRSDVCLHNQCFDAMSFLQLQEQAPLWQCPICNKTVQWRSLRIDNYVADIVRNCPKDVEQVTIEPNGHWSPVNADTSNGRTPNGRAIKHEQGEEDDDEDLVEIQEPSRPSASFVQPLWTPPGAARTPPYSSREQSINSATTRSSAKRPVSAVIDLTNSSDEEEEPPRAAKRHSAYQGSAPRSASQQVYFQPPQGGDPYNGSRPPISFTMQSRQQNQYYEPWRAPGTQQGGNYG